MEAFGTEAACLRLLTHADGLFTDANAVDHVAQSMEVVEVPTQEQKNFVIDSATPHGDTVLTETSVLKPSVGWVTVHATEGLTGGCHV